MPAALDFWLGNIGWAHFAVPVSLSFEGVKSTFSRVKDGFRHLLAVYLRMFGSLKPALLSLPDSRGPQHPHGQPGRAVRALSAQWTPGDKSGGAPRKGVWNVLVQSEKTESHRRYGGLCGCVFCKKFNLLAEASFENLLQEEQSS